MAGAPSRERMTNGNFRPRRASLFRVMVRPDRAGTETNEMAAPRLGRGNPPAGTPGGRASLPNEENEPDTRTDGVAHAAKGGGTGEVGKSRLSDALTDRVAVQTSLFRRYSATRRGPTRCES
jgi:anti-sigma factor RsiW